MLISFPFILLNSCNKGSHINEVISEGKSANRIYSFANDTSIVPLFIDSVNEVYNRQFSYQEINIDSALDLIEASLNFSFSDLDSALKNHDTLSYTANFHISTNSNGLFNFIDVANETKSLANYIRTVCTGTNLRLNVCRVDKINGINGDFKLVCDIGEIDASFNFLSQPEPPSVTGNHLWRFDEYEFYGYVNCELSKPYAPKVLQDKISQYLRDVTTYRVREIALAAPFGYVVYYDNWEFVDEGGQKVFDYTDFINLSKLDWPSGILSSVNHLNCGGKQGEPFKAPIYAADPNQVACFILFDPVTYGHKSCINSAGMNYYINKSLHIWDALRPTTLVNMFHSIHVSYAEPFYVEDPIRHLYSFKTVRAKTRQAGASIL